MKKIILFCLLFIFAPLITTAQENSLNDRLAGRIILAVQNRGEAYWINPVDKLAYYLGRPADAFTIMRNHGLGINEEDFKSFNNFGAPKRLSGRILIRPHANGEAYYVNPLDLRLWFLGGPLSAFNAMKHFGLGVSNADLAKVTETKTQEFVDETAKWAVYQYRSPYDNYGFEVRYPNSWKVSVTNDRINFMPIGGQDVFLSFFIYMKPVSEAEKLLPIFSVPNREVNSRTNIVINNISWTKLVIGNNQIAQLTYSNGNTYAAQYSTFEDISPKIISTFKFIK